jgi:hypothetical protein
MEHVGTEEDRLAKEQRLERIVPSYRDETSSDEDDCSKAIEAHQLAHRIKKDHLTRGLLFRAR